VSNSAYRLTRAAVRVVSAPFVRLRVWRAPGASELSGGAVVVSNHISHFDPGFLTVAFRRPIDWMTTAEFYSHPLAAAWLRAVHVKSDGSMEGVDEIHAQLDPDEFMEGRRVLVAQLLGLLVAFIGENLTLRLVREIWPEISLNNLNFITGDKSEKAQ